MPPNCRGRYPSTIKGCRDYFSANVVAAIHIGVDDSLPAGRIPAPVPPATETWFRCPGRIIHRDIIAVKKTGFAGIALLGENHTDAHQLCFVGEQLDETGMRDLHKVLVIALAHLDFLLPERVLADNQRPDALLHQQLDNATAGRMQGMHDAATALRRNTIKLARRTAALLRKATLRASALLVVILIPAFDRLAVDQTGDETGFIRGESRQNTDAQISRHKQSRIDSGRFRLRLVDYLDHVMVSFGHKAHLGDGLSVLGSLHQCP